MTGTEASQTRVTALRRRMRRAKQQAAEPGWQAGHGWQREPKAGEGDSDAITKGRGVLIWPYEAGGFDEDWFRILVRSQP